MSNIKIQIESPTDSVLQDRMEIANHERAGSHLPLAFTVLIFGLIGGLIWYFATPVPKQPSVSPAPMQAMVAPQPVTPAPPTHPPTHSNHVVETKPTLVTTPVVKPEVVEKPAPKPEQVTPTVETKPVEKPAEKPVETPTVPQPAALPISKEELLARAKEQISRTRLTLPIGDNAYETYQALLKVSQKDAEQILDAIAQWHYEQGGKWIKQDRLTTPTKGNAYQLYEKMKELVPKHPNTEKLLDEILQGFEDRVKKQMTSNNPAEKNGVYNTCKEISQLAPNHPAAKSCLNQVATELLDRAKKQVADKLFLSPANNNAFDTYQKILKIVPDHPQAQAGLKSLAREYYKLAIKTKNEKKFAISKEMVEKGLQINPEDNKLLELKKQLENIKS